MNKVPMEINVDTVRDIRLHHSKELADKMIKAHHDSLIAQRKEAEKEFNKILFFKKKYLNICVSCGKREVEDGNIRCKKCAEAQKKSKKNLYESRKILNICIYCGKKKPKKGKLFCSKCAKSRIKYKKVDKSD